MEIGFSTLDRRRLEDLKETDFERFCEELVRFEARERHRNARVNGPLTAGAADGGKDLHLVVTATPLRDRAHFAEALTEDEVAETFFSCKAGDNWQRSVKEDAAKKGGMARVLARGGRLTILVNRPVDVERLTVPPTKTPGQRAKKTFIRQVAEAAAKAMTGMRKKLPSLEEIERRVSIYDASSIVAFLRVHRPSLGAEFKSALGIVEPPGVLSLKRWSEEQRAGRGLPPFEPDDERERLIALLVDMMGAAAERTLWISGVPGIGKTRLVIEALSRMGEQRGRICVAPREPIGAEALERYDLIARMPETVLVVDECPAARVHVLYSKFAAAVDDQGAPAGRARLILIGPPGDAMAPLDLRKVSLGPLGDPALRRVIESEYGGTPSRVDAILRLSEGFPWYAVLLSREFRRSHVTPPDEVNTQQAAKLAIAPWNDHIPEEAWRRVVYARARALLSVILTERRAWRSLDDDARHALHNAVGLPSWPELTDRVRDCVDRGLIRQSEDTEFRYVTPAVLAREVVTLLLRPPDGGGPELRRHTPELADGLYERLSELGVSLDIQRELAREDIAGWRRDAPDLPGLMRLATPRSFLFASRLCPRETASYLREVIDNTPPPARALRTIAAVAPALGHLISRRGCFADAEGALFPLVVAEGGESMRPATDVWSRSLVPAWGETYATVGERYSVLAGRVDSRDAPARLAALAALEHIASSERWWTVHAPHDGAWPTLALEEVLHATSSAWRLLARRTGDVDAAVATRARGIVCRRLRNAVRAGIADGAVDELSLYVRAWADASRSDLRATLDLIERHDASFVAAAEGLAERIRALLGELAPRTWRERLFDRVAHWLPGASAADAERVHDLALAREGVAGDAALVHALDWLDTPDARRANAFMTRVGEVDSARMLLPHLLQRARSGVARNVLLLPQYLKGMADAEGQEAVDSLLRMWRGDRALARTTLMTVWLLGASEEHIAWILADLRAGELTPADLRILQAGPWARGVPWRVLEPLVAQVLAGATRDPPLALCLINRRAQLEPDLATALTPLLSQALAAVLEAGTSGDSLAEHEWEVGLGQLLELGRRDEALELATRALDQGAESGVHEHAWAALLRLAQSDAAEVWWRIAPKLDGPLAEEARWDWRWQALGLLVSADVLLAWIGDDPWRARVAASFTDVYTAPLSQLARALLTRFGASGDVAAVLLTRALNPPPNAESHASFIREQTDRAHAWTSEGSPEVSAWARRCAAALHEFAERSARADVG